MKKLYVVCLMAWLIYPIPSIAALPFAPAFAPVIEGIVSGIVGTITGQMISSPDDSTLKYEKLLAEINTLKEQIKTDQSHSEQELAVVKRQVEVLQEILVKLQQDDSPGEKSAALEKLSPMLSDKQKTESLQKQPLQFDIVYSFRPKNEGELQPLREGTILHSGDTYKIVFTPKQDAYVYIFQVDGHNQLSRLFPNQRYGETPLSQPNHYVSAGRTYHIPSEQKSFQLDKNTGEEKIYFVATTEQDHELEKLNNMTLKEAEPILLRGRGVSGIVDDPKGSSSRQQIKTDDGQISHLANRKLFGECGNNCVSILTFKHR